jgi:hypothetical protein
MINLTQVFMNFQRLCRDAGLRTGVVPSFIIFSGCTVRRIATWLELKQMVAEQTAVLALGLLAARHFNAAVASLALGQVTSDFLMGRQSTIQVPVVLRLRSGRR